MRLHALVETEYTDVDAPLDPHDLAKFLTLACRALPRRIPGAGPAHGGDRRRRGVLDGVFFGSGLGGSRRGHVRRPPSCRCSKPSGTRLKIAWPTSSPSATGGCGCRRRRGPTAATSRWGTTCSTASTWASRGTKRCTAPRRASRRSCASAHTAGVLVNTDFIPNHNGFSNLGTVDTHGTPTHGGRRDVRPERAAIRGSCCRRCRATSTATFTAPSRAARSSSAAVGADRHRPGEESPVHSPSGDAGQPAQHSRRARTSAFGRGRRTCRTRTMRGSTPTRAWAARRCSTRGSTRT